MRLRCNVHPSQQPQTAATDSGRRRGARGIKGGGGGAKEVTFSFSLEPQQDLSRPSKKKKQ